MKLTAYCRTSGVIEFREERPKATGARMPIMYGEAKRVRRTITDTARHAKGSDALLVPGVPEADGTDAAFDALQAFRVWLHTRHPRLVTACGPIDRTATQRHTQHQARILEALTNAA